MIFIKRTFRSFKTLLAIGTCLLPSFLRVRILRLAGFKIGKNVTISPLTIIAADEVEIGNDAYISPLVLIFNLKSAKIGNRAYISLGTFVYGHGPGSFEIGDFGATGLFCIINCTCDVTLGKYSCLGPRSMVSTHGNFLPKIQGFSNRYGEVKIGHHVWVMMDVKITSGVTIGDYVIAHAGTVITSDVPSNSVYTHSRKSFRVQPMNAIYRRTVNDEFLQKWKATLFSDLPSFVEAYFDLPIECAAKDAHWEISTPNGIFRIWDEASVQNLDGGNVGTHDIVIITRNVCSERLRLYCDINWLDVNLNLYNRATPSPFFDYIEFYFEMKHGVYFTLYEK